MLNFTIAELDCTAYYPTLPLHYYTVHFYYFFLNCVSLDNIKYQTKPNYTQLHPTLAYYNLTKHNVTKPWHSYNMQLFTFTIQTYYLTLQGITIPSLYLHHLTFTKLDLTKRNNTIPLLYNNKR